MTQSRAQLDLAFARRADRTVLAARHVSYPFFVTAALRRTDATAEIFVQSVAGGVFGDDCLHQRVEVAEGAAAILRMPSATVVHRAGRTGASRQAVLLRTHPGARLFYLPRPLILLPGSALEQVTEITLGRGSTVLIQDGFLFHDPHGTPPAARRLDSRMTIRRSTGRLVALERLRVGDASLGTAGPGMTNPYRAFGTVWLLHETTPGLHEQLSAATARIFAGHPAYMAMTRLRDAAGVLIRIAAPDGGDLDTALTAIREAMLGLPWLQGGAGTPVDDAARPLTPAACAPRPPP
jgi:urease accessory protein UreH